MHVAASEKLLRASCVSLTDRIKETMEEPSPFEGLQVSS